jgi:hypothetical protein
MAIPKMMSGARAIFRVNNRVIAFATNANYTIQIPHTAVNVLGRFTPARHEPTGAEVSVACTVMRFTKKGGAGNSPQKKGSENVLPRIQDILNTDTLSIEIIDRQTDETLLMVAQARCTQRSGSMGSRDLLSEGWQFVGILGEDSDSGPQNEASTPGITPPNTEAAQ